MGGLCTILVVEDSAELRRILRKAFAFAAKDYRMLEAGTIAAGRELLAREKPDILMLDAELPDGSGFDFCREVREGSGIPILLSSGLCGKEHIAKCFGAGCDDYLEKPYLFDTLLERLEALREKVPADAGGGYDMAFVVIEGMPAMETARLVRESASEIALFLVSSTGDYALEGFRPHALDYLIRPVSEERIREAAARIGSEALHGLPQWEALRRI